METPLSLAAPADSSASSGMDSVRSDDSLASSSGSSEDDLNRVPVPRHVLDALRATIAGPLGDPSPAKARIWAFAGPTCLGCCAGYLVHASFGTVSQAWAILSYPGAVAMALNGVIVAECTCHMASAVRGVWAALVRGDMPYATDGWRLEPDLEPEPEPPLELEPEPEPEPAGPEPEPEPEPDVGAVPQAALGNLHPDGDSVMFLERLLGSQVPSTPFSRLARDHHVLQPPGGNLGPAS